VVCGLWYVRFPISLSPICVPLWLL
jgi:hypothetical protein